MVAVQPAQNEDYRAHQNGKKYARYSVRSPAGPDRIFASSAVNPMRVFPGIAAEIFFALSTRKIPHKQPRQNVNPPTLRFCGQRIICNRKI
jgi:hypothetical protein